MIPKMKINLNICEFLGLIQDYRSVTNPSLIDRLPIYEEREPRLYLTNYMTGSVYTSLLCYIALQLNWGHIADMHTISSIFQTAELSEGGFKLVDDRIEKVFRLFINRNWYNYCLIHNTCEKIEDVKVHDINKQVYSLFNNVLSILEMTKDRYLILLDSYQKTANELLAKLVRSSSGSADNKTFTNLTPQTPETNTQDWFDYVNSAVKNLASASDTTSEDKDYLIDKINAIQEKYRNVLKDWSNELDRLCWESE